jgi:hypothetical protein
VVSKKLSPSRPICRAQRNRTGRLLGEQNIAGGPQVILPRVTGGIIDANHKIRFRRRAQPLFNALPTRSAIAQAYDGKIKAKRRAQARRPAQGRRHPRHDLYAHLRVFLRKLQTQPSKPYTPGSPLHTRPTVLPDAACPNAMRQRSASIVIAW